MSESLHSVEVCNSGVGAESAYTDKIEEAKGSTFDILHPSNQPSVPPHRANDDPVLRSIAPSNRHGGAGSHSSGNGSIIPHDVVLEITVYCPKATCSRKGSGKRLYPAKANTFLFHWNQSLSELPAVVQCWEDNQIERMNNRKKTCASGAGSGSAPGSMAPSSMSASAACRCRRARSGSACPSQRASSCGYSGTATWTASRSAARP